MTRQREKDPAGPLLQHLLHGGLMEALRKRARRLPLPDPRSRSVRVALLLLAPVLFFLIIGLWPGAWRTDGQREGRGPEEGEASLERMAGQMLLCGFRGTGEEPISEDLRLLLEDIRAGRVGGVIYFQRDAVSGEAGRNIRTREQVARLSGLLQKDAATPLFIGVDQEGGRVRRFRAEHGFPETPSAGELGKGSPQTTRAAAVRLGTALASVGVNLNFAPALDVNVNAQSPAIGALERSFSADPLAVAAHGRAFAAGLGEAGIIACYKHFPGHGSAGTDTHLGMADITATWRERELTPYRRLLRGGPLAMVMPGHIVHKELTGNLPASLSGRAVGEILRGRLGWQGVTITDDLQMQAVDDHYSQREAMRLAVLAGVDILLYGNNLRHDPAEARKAHALLLDLVRSGEVPEARIRESYRRIMELKRAAGLLAK